MDLRLGGRVRRIVGWGGAVALVSGLAGCAPEIPDAGVDSDTLDLPVERRWAEDVFRTPEVMVDVLFVVDDSRSMFEEQERLAAAIRGTPRLVEPGVRVGVLTTSYDLPESRGRLRRVEGHAWGDADTPGGVAVLAQMVQPGVDGAPDERGKDQVYLALGSMNSLNDDFRRADADLAVIVVSDEPDYSRTIDVHRYLEFLDAEVGPYDHLAQHSIVGPMGGCVGSGGQAMDGRGYLEVSEVLGRALSICEADWAPFLREVTAEAIPLERTFGLSEPPDAKDLRVFTRAPGEAERERSLGLGFAYDKDDNAIVFGEPLPPDTRVRVVYPVAGW